MAITRLGLGGPSADYPGFVAKSADLPSGTPYDRITCIGEDDRTYVVPDESRTVAVLGDPTCED